MATVANPYETPTLASQTGLIGGAMTAAETPKVNRTDPALLKEPVNYNPVSNLQMQSYTATNSAVNKSTDTVAGQVESILSSDSPLMQRARTLALQNMNKRGLVNSSIAAGAGVSAMTDQATQIGSADANIYNQRAIANMDATNRAGEFNAGQNNDTYRQGLDIAARFGLQKDQQGYNTGEREASQAYNTGERVESEKYNTGEREAGQGFTAGQNQLTRDQQDKLAVMGQNFTALQSQLDRDQQTAVIKLTDSLNNSSIPKTYSANVTLATMQAINSILADKDITPEDKKAAIDNVTAVGNANMQWGATFYNTPLPAIGTPGQQAGILDPGAQPAGQPAANVSPTEIPRYYSQYFPGYAPKAA